MPKVQSFVESGKPQPDKFRDLARELECDEDEAKFEETVKRVAKAKPEPGEDGADR